MKSNDLGISVIDGWYKQYYGELVLWADTIVNDVTQSEDIVQDLFVRLWENNLYSHVTNEKAKSYLYTAVRNVAIRVAGKNRKTEHIPDSSLAEQVWEDKEYTREELLQKIEKAVNQLPERSREVLTCVYMKNMKYAEAAEALGITVSTVKTLLVRSLKTLRSQLDGSLFLNLLLIYYQKNDEQLIPEKC